MSMLAEPRRKQRVINLRAKNNAWSNDSNKFGQRMLEKMGWISGKGLGAKENGMIEHVVARYKNDEKGLGYEDKNDQWTKHEDDFNALLANLSNGDVKAEKLHSGVSLEDKSKKSKARVHYHKFTRGKDLTKYSEKDLANIFGKKSLKNKQETPEEFVKEVETKEQIFTDKGSMEDYFKSKMATLKKKMSIFNNNSNDNNDADYAFKGFSGTTNETEKEEQSDGQLFSFYGLQETKLCNKNEITAENIDCDDDSKKKKKKKKDKHRNDILNTFHVENINLNIVVDNRQNEEEVQLEPRKKKKKYKLENLCTDVEISKNIKKSKKKKVEVVQIEQNEMLQTLEETEKQCEDYHVPKKKKKRKNKKDS